MKRWQVTGMVVLVGGSIMAGAAWGAHPGFDMAAFASATSARGGMPAGPASQAPEEPPGPVSGKVVQTMDSGGYTYLLIENKGERRWVAISSAPVTVGQQVTVKPGATMVNFTSKGLNRTFDRIIFSDGLVEQKGGAVSGGAKKSGGSTGAAVPFSAVAVEKAAGPNAYRIAELYANTKLNGRKVSVRGKVVKVSANIMDRNWIHLQDGSGSPRKKNHNLVVTSTELPDTGEIVTITGTLVRNKDFGSGYKYDIIVEKAKFVREPAGPKPPAP